MNEQMKALKALVESLRFDEDMRYEDEWMRGYREAEGTIKRQLLKVLDIGDGSRDGND